MTLHGRLDARWLREGALARLLDVLDRDGEEARVIGGAVRNALIGAPPGDIDVATTAMPQEVIRRAEAAGFKAVPTGIEHGTVTIVVDGKPFEVTTLREDVETFGRHARVAFGRDWKSDAKRRDFTMNALSVTRDGMIHDHVGGLADLEARRVRFIGEPRKRIAEDYLRILRFFRFHAFYGQGGLPDAGGLAACIAERVGLDGLSRERVRMEMIRLMVAPHAVPTLAVMAETGLLEAVLGGVPLLASFSNMTKLEGELSLAPDAVRRLGALGVTIVEDAERLRERLRLANSEYERLVSMADDWRQISVATTEAEARTQLYRLGPQKYSDRVLLAWSRAWEESVANEPWRQLATLAERWCAPAFPLKAADFIARGVAKGPALGEAMRAAEDAWIAAGFPTDDAALANIADGVARERG
jgi:tRNA nucleotidyltransferase/poly(A) polymerase